MIPLEPIPMELRRVDAGGNVGYVIDWDCPTCGEAGSTTPRPSEFLAYYQGVIVESNHGDGRCRYGSP